jgi:hypothetical protein
MTEAETNTGNKSMGQVPGANSPGKADEQKKEEEHEAVKAHVRRLLFGVSCLDCAMKRRKEKMGI